MKEYKLSDFLPTTKKELDIRGWDSVDVILFSADAYVDHPSFGAAVIGRTLEAAGYRVAIVPQPDWHGDFRDLIDSNGFVDEQVLDKLKFNIRAMLETDTLKDNDLLDLCLDVIYHANMKAFGLQQLVLLYIRWMDEKKEAATDEEKEGKE